MRKLPLCILIISIGLNLYLGFREIKEIRITKKIYFFRKHTLIQQGEYLTAYWKIPDGCGEIVGTEITYISKNIVRRY